jgi:hypothetical protein
LNFADFIIFISQVNIKEFEVAEYVLPLYEVIIKTDRHITHSKGKILVEVSARTTYGTINYGLATIRAIRKDNNYTKELKYIEVNEKTFQEFDIKRDLGIVEEEDNVIVKI